MGSQPKAKPMQESVFFADGTTARPLVEGTVARGDLELDSHLYRGFVDGKPALTFPEHYPTPDGWTIPHARAGTRFDPAARAGTIHDLLRHVPRRRR